MDPVTAVRIMVVFCLLLLVGLWALHRFGLGEHAITAGEHGDLTQDEFDAMMMARYFENQPALSRQRAREDLATVGPILDPPEPPFML